MNAVKWFVCMFCISLCAESAVSATDNHLRTHVFGLPPLEVVSHASARQEACCGGSPCIDSCHIDVKKCK